MTTRPPSSGRLSSQYRLPFENCSSLKPIPEDVRSVLVIGDFQEPNGAVVVMLLMLLLPPQ
jgi:hypothetical protein